MGKIVLGSRILDCAQIEERIARAMSGLASLGVGEGDAVALLLRNDIAFLEASLATERLGAYPVPISWHAKANELRHILADSCAKVAVVHAEFAPLLDEAAGVDLRPVIVRTPQEFAAAYALDSTANHLRSEAVEWEALIAAHSGFSEPLKRPRGAILYTSGTTGLPKGIQRQPFATASDQRGALQSMFDSFGIRPGVRTVICGPLYHSMQCANMRAAYAALGEDGVIVLEPRFDAETLLRRIEQFQVTQLLMVPVMFVRLLRLAESVRRQYKLSSLEWVVHSAAPCPAEVKRRMIDWFGPVINEFYAASELGAVTLIGSADAMRKPGSVGRPLPGCIVKVLDRSGRELPPREQGEIAAVNPAYPDFTYRNRPEERAALDRDGLVATGDIGYFDEDRYLFLSGRKNDIVISGGVNIFPAEIEAVLLSCPGVGDCAVFGIPDEEYGEVLAAHIEPAAGADLRESDVREYLRAHLARFKVPKLLRFEPGLPREDSGKIFKRRIRDPYWAGSGPKA